MKSKKLIVLYADDDSDDKKWLEDACNATNSLLNFCFVNDGEEVVRFFNAKEKNEWPDLIVLDLNMPNLDGKQTLHRLKSNEQHAGIPVAIVTTSSNKMDREVCFKMGASLFLTKPNSVSQWKQIVHELEDYLVNRLRGSVLSNQ